MNTPTCSICHWANVGLLNLGEEGSPLYLCPGCIKREREKLLAKLHDLETGGPIPDVVQENAALRENLRALEAQALSDIKLIKHLAAKAGLLAGATPNEQWKRAYQDIERGAALLWRLIERSTVKEM